MRRAVLRIISICNLNSVEAYDYHENKWSYFPSMLSRRRNHTAISISNKMFVIGGRSNGVFGRCLNSCEVFDGVTRKFTFIKTLPDWVKKLNPSQIVSIGFNIYFFVKEKNNEVKVYNFDAKNYVIKLKTSVNFENTKSFSCTKVSMY